MQKTYLAYTFVSRFGSAMIRKVEIQETVGLGGYATLPEFQSAVRDLQAAARPLVSLLQGRTLWMINSTDRGGGVAEMLPKMLQILRELGIEAQWAVIHSKEEEFFHFTKRLHNMVHGSDPTGSYRISAREKSVYEQSNYENAKSLQSYLKKQDVLIVHDPQPMALASMIQEELALSTIWRSHIGTDTKNQATQCAWDFLAHYAPAYEHGIFSAAEYIPASFANKASLIHPAIDPLSDKNRPISVHHLVGILVNAKLERSEHPVLRPDYPSCAKRLQANGAFAVAFLPESFGFLSRPIVTQISRWDRLKGFVPLLQAFVILKEGLEKKKPQMDELTYRRLALLRLALVGPDPASIQDDPEGQEVLAELISLYKSLKPEWQKDIALITLPMDSLKRNALIVNAIQRCSTLIVQNSLQEGFGLTITEAMWKDIPVLSTHAVGPRQQIRDKIDGRLAHDAENVEALAEHMEVILSSVEQRKLYRENARYTVYHEFLIFSQLRKWLKILHEIVSS